MLRVGITGGIGSGKSTVCRIFDLLGIPVFYADEEAKKLYDNHAELRLQIIQHFGETVYPGGVFDRQRMKSIVFANPEKLKLLNSLIHPVVKEVSAKWMSQQTATYAIKEAALLIESGSYESLEEIIVVSSPLTLRKQRVMQRDKIDEEQVMQRISAQMPEEEKIKWATQIIVNDDVHLLIPQVQQIHELFLHRQRV